MTFWSLTNNDFPTNQTFHQFLLPSYRAWPSPILRGFHVTFETGVACQQGSLPLRTLVPPPFGDWNMLWLLRPVFPTLHRINDRTLLDLHRIKRGFHGAFATVGHASRERLPFRTPGAVPHCGTCLCSNCWDQNPRTCHVFTRLFTSNTHWYFLDFACSSNPLNRIYQHLKGSKISTSSTKCVFFGWSGNHDARPDSDWLRHFYSSETAAQFDETSQKERSQRLQPSIRILHWLKKKIAVAASDLLRRFRC